MIVWDEIPRKSRYNRNELIIYRCEEEIRSFIPEFRAEHCLTQRELAKKCEVNQSMVARLESPSPSTHILHLLSILVPLGYTLKIEKLDPDTAIHDNNKNHCVTDF